ncbi:MAG: ABC transporter ATP-binding protein [Bdellovibrionota bacterium]
MKNLILSNWRRFLNESSFIRHYLWKYRTYVGAGIFALIVVDFIEIFPPLFLKEAVDIAVERRPVKELLIIAVCYFGVSIVQALCRYAWRMYLIRAGVFAGRDLRGKFSCHLFGLSASFFDRWRVGDIMSLATSDIEAVRMAIGTGLLVMADALFYFLSIPIAMFWLSPKLAMLAFIPLPIIPLLVMRNEREVHSRFEKVQESLGRLSAMTQECLNGVRVTKAFAKEDVQMKRFRDAGLEFVNLNLKLARVQSAFGPTLDFTMSLGLVLLLFIGGHGLIFSSSFAVGLGTFVAFQRYIQKMIWPMAAIGMAVSYYQRAVSSSGRLKEVFSESSDIMQALEPVLPADHAPGGRWRTRGEVEFKNLSFRFPTSRRHGNEVLKSINIKIAAGERVAFIGTIGAGKSALLSLLPRLYPVGPGMLFIDGIDVNLWPIDELRRQVGYVSQDVFLFSETVIENVAFGLQEWASQPGVLSSIEEATQLASVHEDVIGLSKAYETRLGERGVNLSGGQKQRLTIARALVKKPSVLVLDDALSSVDVHTEEIILEGLRARAGRNTEVIAAHRISTIMDADRIVVLEGGLVRQVGNHRQLMSDSSGIYRLYYEQQRLKEDLENYEAKHEYVVNDAGHSGGSVLGDRV